jgi:cytochrome c biogenesis protein CcdA
MKTMSSQKAIDKLPRADGERQSLSELFHQLATLAAELVRDEFALAKQEGREKLNLLRSAFLPAVMGIVIGQVALIGLCAAAAIALAPVVGEWQSVLIIGGALAVISGGLLFLGLARLKRMSLKPERTLETLEEDKKWLKQQLT